MSRGMLSRPIWTIVISLMISAGCTRWTTQVRQVGVTSGRFEQLINVDREFALAVFGSGGEIEEIALVQRSALGPTPPPERSTMSEAAYRDIVSRLDAIKRIGEVVSTAPIASTSASRTSLTEEREHAVIDKLTTRGSIIGFRIWYFRHVSANVDEVSEPAYGTIPRTLGQVRIGREWFFVRARDLLGLQPPAPMSIDLAGPTVRPTPEWCRSQWCRVP